MNPQMHIAFEISPLLAPTGENGEKSGIYRLLYNTIITLSAKLAKEKSKNILYLFTIYPHLLDRQPNEFNQILKNPQVKLIYIAPYCVKHPFSLLREQIRFFSRHTFGEYSQANYMMRLKQELKRKAVSTIHHSETCFFEAHGFINVITINDLIPIKFPQWCQKKTIENMKKKLAFAKKYCQRVICISRNTKKDLLEYWGEKRGEQIIEVIYPLILPLSTNCQPLSTVDSRLVKGHYFLSYGTYEPRKNYLMLCKLFMKLEKENKLMGHKLVLAGGKGWGGEWEKIEKLNGPIIQLGYMDDNLLSTLISNAKAVLYPTLYEGYGYPIVESLKVGTPILCSDNSSLPEVCGKKCALVKKGEWEKSVVKLI